MGPKTYASIGQLVAGIAALGLAYWQYTKQAPATNPIFLSVFILFSSALVIDKIPLIFSNLTSEREDRERLQIARQEAKEIFERFDRQPGLFAGRHEVVTFPSDDEGLKYCIAICPLAVSVKNTALRYTRGKQALNDYSGHTTEWLQSRHDSIIQNHCTWTEIISTKIGEQETTSALISKLGSSANRFYEAKFLDEEKFPMVQMTIFQLHNGTKEIIFGWQFPGVAHGPCFLTRNEKIIEYFEKYFDHFLTLASPTA